MINEFCEKEMIIELVKQGKDRWQIARELGIAERTVRYYIQELRNQGIPICSNSHSRGYRLGDSEDIRITVADMRSRAYKLLKTAECLERYGIDGQIRMGI